MVLREILKTRSKDSEESVTSDGEKKARQKSSLRGSKSTDLPPPRYVFSVYSPVVFTSEADVRSEETEQLYRSVWRSYATKEDSSRTRGGSKNKKGDDESPPSPSGSVTTTKKKKIRVRMASLIVKMFNRMISEGVLLRERVLITTTSSQVFARVLVSDKTVPMLIMRCERIGIGNVVGACWVTPIELAVVPDKASGSNPDENLLLLDDVSNRGYRTPHHHYSPSEEVDLAELRLLSEKNTRFDGDVHPLLRVAEETSGSDASEKALDMNMARSGLERDESNESVISIGASDIDGSFDDIGPLMEDEDAESLEEGNLRKRDVLMKAAKDVEIARKKWVSIASRMRIEQVLREVESGASFSFDYICYTLIAAWIAGFGLATDSSTVVIASMLVSPLMGPCMGFTFGTMVREWPLVLRSLLNECLSLLLCVFIGFLVGLMFLSDAFRATYDEWPSNEMISRGEELGLIYGILIAIPSGAAVALAQLGKNSGGLTGVAISLSLLPPAVNAGLCWCTALLVKTGANPPPSTLPNRVSFSEFMGCDVEDGYLWCNSLSRCLLGHDICPLHNSTAANSTDVVGGGTGYFDGSTGDDIGGDRLLGAWPAPNDDDATNYGRVGTISFVLTIINIACIFVGGCAMFWLKEVVPIKRKNTFWTHDIKAYRNAKRENNGGISTRTSEIEAIERGIRASIMLNENGRLAKSLQPQKVASGSDTAEHKNMYASAGLLDQIKSDELRSQYASNAIEDAFYVSNVEPRTISSRNLRRRHPSPRNGVSGNKPPSLFTIDEEGEEGGSSLARERESFIRTANRMGGLAHVESVLFFEDEDSSSTLQDQASFQTRRRQAMGLGKWFSSRAAGRENRADVALHLSMAS